MLLRLIQKPIRCTSGSLATRPRFSTAPASRLQCTSRLASTIGGDNGRRASPEQPNHPESRPITRSPAFWASIAFGLIIGVSTSKYSWKLKGGATATVQTLPPSVKTAPSKIIDAMIDLEEDSDSTKYFVKIATAFERQITDIDDVTRLVCYMTLLHALFIPSLSKEETVDQEILPIFPRGSCLQLNKLVKEAEDPRAEDLLRQAEASIHAIRVSACREIHDLLLSDEVNTGQMKPIDVVKAMIEPLQKARFTCSSNIFRPVWDRLAVVLVEKGKKQPKETSGDEQDHAVLG